MTTSIYYATDVTSKSHETMPAAFLCIIQREHKMQPELTLSAHCADHMQTRLLNTVTGTRREREKKKTVVIKYSLNNKKDFKSLVHTDNRSCFLKYLFDVVP